MGWQGAVLPRENRLRYVLLARLQFSAMAMHILFKCMEFLFNSMQMEFAFGNVLYPTYNQNNGKIKSSLQACVGVIMPCSQVPKWHRK